LKPMNLRLAELGWRVADETDVTWGTDIATLWGKSSANVRVRWGETGFLLNRG